LFVYPLRLILNQKNGREQGTGRGKCCFFNHGCHGFKTDEHGWKREEGLETAAQNMLRKGFSYEQTAELSMLDIEKVKELSYTIQAH